MLVAQTFVEYQPAPSSRGLNKLLNRCLPSPSNMGSTWGPRQLGSTWAGTCARIESLFLGRHVHSKSSGRLRATSRPQVSAGDRAWQTGRRPTKRSVVNRRSLHGGLVGQTRLRDPSPRTFHSSGCHAQVVSSCRSLDRSCCAQSGSVCWKLMAKGGSRKSTWRKACLDASTCQNCPISALFCRTTL